MYMYTIIKEATVMSDRSLIHIKHRKKYILAHGDRFYLYSMLYMVRLMSMLFSLYLSRTQLMFRLLCLKPVQQVLLGLETNPGIPLCPG